MKLREKFTKPNINFGTSPLKDRMKTVAQANDEHATSQAGRQNLGMMSQDQKAKSKEFGTQMRAANFKMGSILPEHNSYKPSQLERSSSGQIGLAIGAGGFKPVIGGGKPHGSQAVSSGNMVARGNGSFQTVNQQLHGWIQPAAANRL